MALGKALRAVRPTSGRLGEGRRRWLPILLLWVVCLGRAPGFAQEGSIPPSPVSSAETLTSKDGRPSGSEQVLSPASLLTPVGEHSSQEAVGVLLEAFSASSLPSVETASPLSTESQAGFPPEADQGHVPPVTRAPGTDPGALPSDAEATFYVVMPLGYADALLKITKTGLQLPPLPLKDKNRQQQQTGAGVQSTYLPIDFSRHYAIRGRVVVRMREKIEAETPGVIPVEALLPVLDATVEVSDPNLLVGGKPLVIDTRYTKLLAPGQTGTEPHGEMGKERGFRDPARAALPPLADDVPELQAGEFIVRIRSSLPEGGVIAQRHIYELPDPLEMTWDDRVQELDREVEKFVESALQGSDLSFAVESFYNMPDTLTTPNSAIQAQFLLVALFQNWKDHFRRYPDDPKEGISGIKEVNFDEELLDVARDEGGNLVPLSTHLYGVQRLAIAERVARTGIENGQLIITPVAQTIGGIWNNANTTDFVLTMLGALIQVTLVADFAKLETGTEGLRKAVQANRSLMWLRSGAISVGRPVMQALYGVSAGLAGMSRAGFAGALDWLGTVGGVLRLPSVKTTLQTASQWVTHRTFLQQTGLLGKLNWAQTGLSNGVKGLRDILNPPAGTQLSGRDQVIKALFDRSFTGDWSGSWMFLELQWLAAVTDQQSVFNQVLSSQGEAATNDQTAQLLEAMLQTVNVRLIPGAVEAARLFRFAATDPRQDGTLPKVDEALARIAEEQIRVRDQFVGVLQKVREVGAQVDNNLNFFLASVATAQMLVGAFGTSSALIVLFPTFEATLVHNPYVKAAILSIGLTQAAAKLLHNAVGVYQGEMGKAAVHDIFNSTGDGVQAPFGSLDDLWTKVLTREITLEDVPALGLLEQAVTRLQEDVLDGIHRPWEAQTEANIAKLAAGYDNILATLEPYQIQRNRLLLQLEAVQLAIVPHALTFSQRQDFQRALNDVRTSLSRIDTGLSTYISAVAEAVTETGNPFMETDYWTRQNYLDFMAEVNGFRNTYLPRLSQQVGRYRYGPVVTVGVTHHTLPEMVEQGSTHPFGIVVSNVGTVPAVIQSVSINSANGLGVPPDGVQITALTPSSFTLQPGTSMPVTGQITFLPGDRLEFVSFGVAIEVEKTPGVTANFFTFIYERTPQVAGIEPAGVGEKDAVSSPYPVQEITVSLGDNYQRAAFFTWVDGKLLTNHRQGATLKLAPGWGLSQLQPGLHTCVVQALNVLTNQGGVWPVQFRVSEEPVAFTDFEPAQGAEITEKAPVIRVRHTLVPDSEYPLFPPGVSEKFDYDLVLEIDGQRVAPSLDLTENGNVRSGLISYPIPPEEALSPQFRMGWHTATVTLRVKLDKVSGRDLAGKTFVASWLFRVMEKGE